MISTYALTDSLYVHFCISFENGKVVWIEHPFHIDTYSFKYGGYAQHDVSTQIKQAMRISFSYK